jgi:hypothetical protein
MIQLMESKAFGHRFILNGSNTTLRFVIEQLNSLNGFKGNTINLNEALANSALYVENFLSLFGRRQLLSKDILRSAFDMNCYSTDKVTKTIGINFIPVEKSLGFYFNTTS